MKLHAHILFDRIIMPHYELIQKLVRIYFKGATTDRSDDMLQMVLIKLFKIVVKLSESEAEEIKPLIIVTVKHEIWKQFRSVNDRMGISKRGMNTESDEISCNTGDFDELIRYIDYFDEEHTVTAYNTKRKDYMKHYSDSIYSAVNKLTELQRTTIFGILEGYSFEELSEQLAIEGHTNTDVNNLMLQYYYGIGKLKESLKNIK